MSEKKNILSVIALCLAALSLVVSGIAVLNPGQAETDYAAEIDALRDHNALLQSQLDALSAQIGSSTQGGGLKGWDLSLTPWENATGASVTLTAVPASYEEGMNAALSVRLGGKEVENVPCSWTGDSFTATVELPAEDGYGYYCVLMDPEGVKQQFALTSTENPVLDVPVYLASALKSYCNMTVDSWYDADGVLTLSLAFVQAQLPRVAVGGQVPEIQSAQLKLNHNGNAFSTLPITLTESGGQGAYELTVSGAELAMPEMELEDYLDLYLEITLSDGQTLTALGASWYCNEDGIFAVMG